MLRDALVFQETVTKLVKLALDLLSDAWTCHVNH
jgi:hypothetical protein